MDFNWLQSILYGFISGIADILPVSAQAHRLLLLKMFGQNAEPGLLRLMTHLGVFAAVYWNCQPQIVKIIRAKSLTRIPKRRRKRPLDTKSLMDFRLWQTMILPVILVYIFYGKISALHNRLILMAVFLFINGIILYVPQFLPSSNKDSRTLSRVEGLLMGLAGAASVLPGISGIGACVSVSSICGVDRAYALSMSLLMQLVITGAMIVFDVMAVLSGSVGIFSFAGFIFCVAAAVAAYLGTFAAIRIMRSLAQEKGYVSFTIYCWGIAIFTFILNLLA